ncbi:hypothetical protein [Alistipes ihumii]|uniref:hypothetical protein n=1 Tax=Alistipes ihumii TaxID=1470347 RepID=UPI0039940644
MYFYANYKVDIEHSTWFYIAVNRTDNLNIARCNIYFIFWSRERNQCLSLQKGSMKTSAFNKALDSFNEYMASQGGYLFDPPVQEFSSTEGGYVFLGNRNSSFGRYAIETGVFIPDGEDEAE